MEDDGRLPGLEAASSSSTGSRRLSAVGVSGSPGSTDSEMELPGARAMLLREMDLWCAVMIRGGHRDRCGHNHA